MKGLTQRMPANETGNSPRKVGRRHKPHPSSNDPLDVLAGELVALKMACGDPSYATLAGSTGIYKTALVEAGSSVKLHQWPVIEAYVRGCWAFYERTCQEPFDGGGDLSRWQQLYRNAGGTLPGENPDGADEPKPGAPVPATVNSAAARTAAVRSRLLRLRGQLATHGRIGSVPLAIGIAACAALLLAGGLIGLLSIGGPPHPAVTPDPPHAQGSITVAAPAPACGRSAADGFRSPASTPFRDVKPVYTVSLEGPSVNMMQGTYNGTAYDWAESNPSGSRAGIQLRWANMPQEWHYCTATVEAGDASGIPGQVATIAVPATVSGRKVTYQVCIWHKDPFTEQCSNLLQA
jgi:hypothetical protein